MSRGEKALQTVAYSDLTKNPVWLILYVYCMYDSYCVSREFQRSPEWDVKLATFLNENFVPDNPLLKMMKPLPADFNFGAAFAAYTDTLIG